MYSESQSFPSAIPPERFLRSQRDDDVSSLLRKFSFALPAVHPRTKGPLSPAQTDLSGEFYTTSPAMEGGLLDRGEGKEHTTAAAAAAAATGAHRTRYLVEVRTRSIFVYPPSSPSSRLQGSIDLSLGSINNMIINRNKLE